MRERAGGASKRAIDKVEPRTYGGPSGDRLREPEAHARVPRETRQEIGGARWEARDDERAFTAGDSASRGRRHSRRHPPAGGIPRENPVDKMWRAAPPGGAPRF